MTGTTRTEPAESGNLLLDLANAFVAIHKERYGRGPDKSRAHVVRDVVVVLLEGGFSRAEQTLMERGSEDAVNQGRAAMQATIEDPAVGVVERLTGRKVRSFMSANDAAQELQAEIFVLEPEGEATTAEHAELCARAQAARDENADVREDLRALRAEQVQARDALHRNRTQGG